MMKVRPMKSPGTFPNRLDFLMHRQLGMICLKERRKKEGSISRPPFQPSQDLQLLLIMVFCDVEMKPCENATLPQRVPPPFFFTPIQRLQLLVQIDKKFF